MHLPLAMMSVAAVGLSCGPATAARFIYCTREGEPEISISLNSRFEFAHSLSCIRGKFIEDMTPCAPDNGYGLSAPTGEANLVGVVMRWQDYGRHLGPVMSFHYDETHYYFSGGFHDPDGGYKQDWNFEVSRLSGKGLLGQEGRPTLAYRCQPVHRRF